MNTKKTVALTLLAVMLFGGCGEKTKNDPEKLLKTGKYEEASETYIALIDKDSENADLYTGLADAYVGMKEYEAAVDTLCEGYELTGIVFITSEMFQVVDAFKNTHCYDFLVKPYNIEDIKRIIDVFYKNIRILIFEKTSGHNQTLPYFKLILLNLLKKVNIFKLK